MKKCYSLLLMTSLIWITGLPLLARENSGGFVMEERYQSQELSGTSLLLQDVEILQNRDRTQKGDTIQHKEQPQHSPDESQDTVGIQSIETLQNATQLQDQRLFNNEEPQEKTKIRLTGNRLIIEELPQDGILEIYNIMGAKVYNRRAKAGTNEYILSLPKGYYIVKIGKFTRKIAVK